VKAAGLLLTEDDVRLALGADIHADAAAERPAGDVGEVLRAAAVDSAYRRFTGAASGDGEEAPVAVGALALIFDSENRARHTFERVAEAAHLRRELAGCQVAVETVTASGGLVSYWAYVQRAEAIVVLTLDTLNPQSVSMTEFRTLAMRTAERLSAAVPR
jgi:hypothetical protein